MKNKNAGFSLVELIITISIMAALVGVFAPMFFKYFEESKESKAIYRAEAYRVAVETAIVHAASGSGPESNLELINAPQAFSSLYSMPGDSVDASLMREVCLAMHAGTGSEFEAIALVDDCVVRQVTFHDMATDKVYVWFIQEPSGGGLQNDADRRNEWVVYNDSSNWVSDYTGLSSVRWNGL